MTDAVAQPVAPEKLLLKDGRVLAYQRYRAVGNNSLPGVVFMGGFRSDMTGGKAQYLDRLCRENGISFLRFDYTGHGASSGDFLDGCIGDWSRDALDAIDALTEGPQVLVGSSMGGWIMLNVALARPERVAGLLGIAAAPDFTEALMWAEMSPDQQQQLMHDGRIEMPNDYSDEPYVITRRLIEDGREHLRLDRPLPIKVPVRLLHGLRDTDVPWQLARQLLDHLDSDDVELTLIRAGDHRLSEPRPLARLGQMLLALLVELPAPSA